MIAGARPPLVASGGRLAFAAVACLFFAWALANSLNDVLVRHFRRTLTLGRAEAGLVQSAFYIGYFVAALPAARFMERWGYKAGLLLGLGLYAAGAFSFWPAAETRAFPPFLAALTVMALGLACLETAANPYVAVLGPAETAPARLNLAQAFNGVGAVTGPLVGGAFILSHVEAGAAAADPRAVQVPYAGLGLFVLALAGLIAAVRLPALDGVGPSDTPRTPALARLLRRPRFLAAVAAQFFYVAAQVCVWSYFIDFAKEQLPGTTDSRLAFLLSSSIALLMIGRFLGAAVLRVWPARTLLTVAGVAAAALCATAALAHGAAAVAALWTTSLCMSVMFPTIFSLGVRGLGPATKLGGSLLIMSIVGGAILPPALGAVGDWARSLQPAMAIPALCFLVVAWFGAAGAGLGRDDTLAEMS